jgi:hypothetical protein
MKAMNSEMTKKAAKWQYWYWLIIMISTNNNEPKTGEKLKKWWKQRNIKTNDKANNEKQ